jgi:hypothetical protein
MYVCIRGGPQKSALAPHPLKIYCAYIVVIQAFKMIPLKENSHTWIKINKIK